LHCFPRSDFYLLNDSVEESILDYDTQNSTFRRIEP